MHSKYTIIVTINIINPILDTSKQLNVIISHPNLIALQTTSNLSLSGFAIALKLLVLKDKR